MDTLVSFFARNGLLPHAVCLTGSAGLLWGMVAADALIAAAYFSIPLTILRYTRRRGALPSLWVPGLFSAFIFACGLTHVLDIWTLWQPDYVVQVLAKGITAALSIATAIALWQLLPQALKIPSVARLQEAIASLEAEVGRRLSTEQRLAEIEQSLALTLASIEAGFIAADPQGRVTRMNAVAERVTGWSQQAALGQPLWTVFMREGRAAGIEARNPIDVMQEQGVTMELAQHVVALSRTGQPTALEVKADLTHSDSGAVRGLVMVFRDLTAINQVEADRARLAAIVESSNDAIISKSLDGRITSWNRAAEALYGYNAEQAIGRPVQMLIPAEREAEEMQILADLALGKTLPPFDTVRQARDGTRLAVSVAISPIRDAVGRVVGASKIARDVSLQRRAEAALRESAARLRFVLDSAQIGEWEIDLNSGITRSSPRFDACFGLLPGAASWTFDSFLRQVHAEDHAEVQRSFQAAVRQGQDWQIECRVHWPDRSVHWLRLHGAVLPASGQAGRMLGVVSDITAQRQAEEARLRALRLEAEHHQVLEASRLKSQFLANMSHELRTPLNAIIGFAELLKGGAVPASSPKHGEFLGHIASSGHHLLQLINDVLDLAKVESGKFDFTPEPVDLAQRVGEALAVLGTAVQRKHLAVEVLIAPGLGGLVLDPARFKQVLYNYLSNAIKFTPERGRITVRATVKGTAHFRVEVEDTGIGIAAADLPRLFTEFQQLDAGYSKHHAGTGLGLALTRRLVAAQGGSTGVRSSLGLGSVFYLVLPRVHGTAAAASSTGAGAPASPDRRWLVIEQDADRQQHWVSGLATLGITAITADSGEAARQLAAGEAYGAITLGLQLPDQTGLSTLDVIRNQSLHPDAPVTAMTLHTEPGAAASFAISNLLRKPIDAREVLAAIAGLQLPAGRTPQVLVIDDDPMALDLMRSTLQGAGAQGICQLDARQALRDIGQHRPDAIILDLMMPGFDGFATLDALRQMPHWRDTPVFIWTSMVLTDDEYASLSRSAQAIINKGGGALTDLFDALRRWRPLAHPLPGNPPGSSPGSDTGTGQDADAIRSTP